MDFSVATRSAARVVPDKSVASLLEMSPPREFPVYRTHSFPVIVADRNVVSASKLRSHYSAQMYLHSTQHLSTHRDRPNKVGTPCCPNRTPSWFLFLGLFALICLYCLWAILWHYTASSVIMCWKVLGDTLYRMTGLYIVLLTATTMIQYCWINRTYWDFLHQVFSIWLRIYSSD